MHRACKLDGDRFSGVVPALELQTGIGVHPKGRRWSELMLRLLLLGLIGVAAYRIGSEFFRTIPSDFEPVPSPTGNPKRSSRTGQKPGSSESPEGSDAGDR
jgi:hypothetical protein